MVGSTSARRMHASGPDARYLCLSLGDLEILVAIDSMAAERPVGRVQTMT